MKEDKNIKKEISKRFLYALEKAIESVISILLAVINMFSFAYFLNIYTYNKNNLILFFILNNVLMVTLFSYSYYKNFEKRKK